MPTDHCSLQSKQTIAKTLTKMKSVVSIDKLLAKSLSLTPEVNSRNKEQVKGHNLCLALNMFFVSGIQFELNDLNDNILG